jgi:hypothetical protein
MEWVPCLRLRTGEILLSSLIGELANQHMRPIIVIFEVLTGLGRRGQLLSFSEIAGGRAIVRQVWLSSLRRISLLGAHLIFVAVIDSLSNTLYQNSISCVNHY